MRERVRQVWPDGGGTTPDWGARWRRLKADLKEWLEQDEVQDRLARLALQGALAAALVAAGALVRWLPLAALDSARTGTRHALTRDFTAGMAWQRAAAWADRQGGWGPALGGAYGRTRSRLVAWVEPLRPARSGTDREAPPAQPPAPAAPLQSPVQPPAHGPPVAAEPGADRPGVLSVRRPGDAAGTGTPGPAVRPVAGKVLVPFGWRGDELHYGVDLAAAPGTPVRAMWPGKVAAAGTDPRLGPYVELEHGGGFASRYAPIKELAVKVGDAVAAGRVLGQVGVGGEAGAGHLHLEVRKGGLAVQPEPFLTGGGGI